LATSFASPEVVVGASFTVAYAYGGTAATEWAMEDNGPQYPQSNYVPGEIQSSNVIAGSTTIATANIIVNFAKDGGASSSAQHLAMLLGYTVAGFAPHPGMPDPEGRDRKHNAEGLRNDLRNIQSNMRSGETIQDFLAKQGWGENQIQSYITEVNNYVDNILDTDVEYYNVSQDLADEILNLVNELGIQ
jgi:hypothetical protein